MMGQSAMPSAGSGQQVKATVKWFNLRKGFGFVATADGQDDAFLHSSILNRAGMQSIADGAELIVEVGPGAKGRQVTRIVEILNTPQQPVARSFTNHAAPSGDGVETQGTVKWYKADKGFGFVAADDGDKDVFIHRSVLMRAGVGTLDPGQKVKIWVNNTPKGREATSMQILSD
jgi:cold shock protein